MLDDEIKDLIKKALAEDIRSGDITTKAVIPSHLNAEGDFLIKGNGIIAGLEIAKEVFFHIDNGLKFKELFNDGSSVKKGDIAPRPS